MYKSILLPIDLAHESSWTKALPVARALATTFGAQIHLYTVISDVTSSQVGQFFPADFEQKARAHAADGLAKLAADGLAGIKHDIHIDAGRAYQKIVDTASALNCDLIVMASHHPELADYLIGPNAEKVVRHADMSVMVVRG